MNVKAIGDFVKRIIKPGGFFAFTFFDGDKILADNGLAKPVANSAVDDGSSIDNTEELTFDSLTEDDNAEELESMEDTEELTKEGGAKRRRKAKKAKGCDSRETKEHDSRKAKGGAIHIKIPNRNRKRSSGKLGNLNIDNEEEVTQEDDTFRPMNNAKQYGEFTIEPFKKGDRWYGKFPLPTIASSGYREEPLVLRKELECLGQDFTEYMDLSNDEYFGLLRLRVYRY
jgi:hypothetical protein